jgi:4-deoxy-L-threo-5-hexosulose-uronate ketol-isomerase
MKYLPDAEQTMRMTTEELREHFLVQNLFRVGEVTLRSASMDRVIVGGIVPTTASLGLGTTEELASETFAERREIGLLNLGGSGRVDVEGTAYEMARLDVLYIGRGRRDIAMGSADASEPAVFYLVSYPAHAEYPTVHIKRGNSEDTTLGSSETASLRRLRKYIRPGVVESAQLVMGITEIQEGSVWNTMPAHTHERRTEVYLYFDLAGDNVVFHLMGEPTQTRSLVVRDREAVLSPGWSIHAGAGTGRYTFCWAMGGENQDFDDMQFAAMEALR